MKKRNSGREGREPPGTHLIIDWQCEIYEAEHGTSTVKAHQPVGNRLNRNRPASTEKDQEGVQRRVKGLERGEWDWGWEG